MSEGRGNLVEVSNFSPNNLMEFVESSFVLVNCFLRLAVFLFEVAVDCSCQRTAIQSLSDLGLNHSNGS